MRIGNGFSYLGDTLNVMDDLIMDGVKVDYILTSPPYNMKGHAKEIYNSAQSFDDHKDNEEYRDWIVNIFLRYNDLLSEAGVIIFNMNYMSAKENRAINLFQTLCAIEEKTPFTLIDQICWKKTNGMPLPEARLSRVWENVWVFIRKDDWEAFWIKYKSVLVGKPNFIEAPNNDGSNPLNKACFSSSMVEQLLKLYNVQQTSVVLDNFMGTHTTALACEKIGCGWIGIELDKETQTFGCDRIKSFLGDFKSISKYGSHNLFSILGDS
jgi:DNA modification methylase